MENDVLKDCFFFSLVYKKEHFLIYFHFVTLFILLKKGQTLIVLCFLLYTLYFSLDEIKRNFTISFFLTRYILFYYVVESFKDYFYFLIHGE